MIQRTVVFPIHSSKEKKDAILETIKLYSQACSYCIDAAWNMKYISAMNLHKATYKFLKKKLSLKSQYLCSARNRAVENVKAMRNLAKRGKTVSKPTSKQIPIRLDARTLSFDKYIETASVATQHGRIRIALTWHKQARRYKGWNCKAGELGINRKGKFVLRLVFEKKVIKPQRSKRIIGIDRGIRHSVVASNNKFIGEGWWREHERNLLSLRAKLQSKGTKSAGQHLKKLAGRLRRFKENCDRIVAKMFFSDLLPGDTIVFEKLTNIRQQCGTKGKARKKHRANMGRWSFKRLENAITYLAELHGIYVEYVEAHYTSQTCSRCNIVLKKNRKSQSSYSCSCGLNLNADLNAARNISKNWYIANGFVSGLQSISLLCSVARKSV
jgi:IS605 OrfB family transposase